MRKINLTNILRLILLMTTLTVLVGACNICGDRMEGRIKLTDAQKKSIPYKKGDVVSFIDRTEKVIDLTVTERKRYWYEMELYPGGMCSDYFRFEGESIVLASDDLKISMRLSLNSSDSDAEGNYGVLRWDGSCTISASMQLVYSSWQEWLYLGMNVDDKGVFSDTQHESLEINNHVYSNVIERIQEIKGSDGKQHSVQFFYNKTHGILQVNADGKNFLALNSQF